MSSLRTHDDTWDIATSVGMSAGSAAMKPTRRHRP